MSAAVTACGRTTLFREAVLGQAPEGVRGGYTHCPLQDGEGMAVQYKRETCSSMVRN